ncbi:MAG: hypothetical protein LBL71_02950, partial [Endomicrobium sp.]|nr:hypothetical protein [Endomicrobium sp.]
YKRYQRKIKWIKRATGGCCDLLEAAVRTKAIIISAAQFVRSGNKGTGRDNFSEESFRECGDIEQDAHNAIGIGWKNDKEERFIEILKTREDRKQSKEYEIEFNGSYSYMAIGEEIKEEEKEE